MKMADHHETEAERWDRLGLWPMGEADPRWPRWQEERRKREAKVEVAQQDDLFGAEAPRRESPKFWRVNVIDEQGDPHIFSDPETDTLEGVALNYWTARAIDAGYAQIIDGTCFADYRAAERAERGAPFAGTDRQMVGMYEPSVDWRQGGYVIERHKIDIAHDDGEWYASTDIFDKEPKAYAYGPTALIAAMRCIVRRRFGERCQIILESCDVADRERNAEWEKKWWRNDPVKTRAALEELYEMRPDLQAYHVERDHEYALEDDAEISATEQGADRG
jgi:hypothetical protein